MKAKLILVTMAVLTLCVASFGTSAFDIQWWSATTYSNSPANTLKQWAEGMEGRVGLSGSASIGTGNIYYVDSNVSSEGDGTTWTSAKNTLDEAVALCTANNGDVIYVAQGHNEAWTTVDSADLDVAGITVIGCGEGLSRPTFDFDDTDPELVLGAADITIRNLNFKPSVTAVVHAIEIEADANNCVIDGCWFMNGELSGTDEFIDAIQPAALANDVTIVNCMFESYGAAGANTGIDLTAGVNKNWKIVGNYFSGDYAEAPIYSDNDVHLRMYIAHNTCYNTSAGQYGIEFGGAATGVLAYNVVYTDAVATAIDPGSLAPFDNLIINTTDLSAIQFPPLPAIGTVTAGSAEDILKKLYYGSDGTGAYPATLANDSALAMILAKGATATPSTYSNTTDSLEAIRDNIDTLNAADQVDLDAILADTAAQDTEAEWADLSSTVIDNIIAAMDANSTDLAILNDLGGLSEVGDKVVADMDANSLLVNWTAVRAAILTDLAGISEIGDKIVADMDANSTLVTILADTGAMDTEAEWADLSSTVVDNVVAAMDANSTLATVLADTAAMDTEAEWADLGSTLVDNVQGAMDANSTLLYWTERGATQTATNNCSSDDLFDVAGGPILITSFFAIVTEAVDSNVATLKIMVDRDDLAADTDFTTAVAVDTDVVGTVYIFTNANPAVLTPLTPGAVGSTSLMMPWVCPEGMIESVFSAVNLDGQIAYYMRWKPLVTGTTVTAQ